jgi:hypothetical protein
MKRKILRRPALPPLLLSLGLVTAIARGGEPPAIPVGLDAYRQWERWPYQRIGARAYMRSTYVSARPNQPWRAW